MIQKCIECKTEYPVEKMIPKVTKNDYICWECLGKQMDKELTRIRPGTTIYRNTLQSVVKQ